MKYRITFYSYWRVGTGLGGDSKDGIVLKDDNKLPVIPGKTLKGLIRDAYTECNLPDETKLFGHVLGDLNTGLKKSDLEEGILYFGTASLPANEQNFLKRNLSLVNGLYRSLTSVRLDNDKQSEDTALNTKEVCIPLTLEAEINLKDGGELDSEVKENLEKAFKMLRMLGEKRYRGMGRCKVEFINQLQNQTA